MSINQNRNRSEIIVVKNWIVFLTVLLTGMTVQGCVAINGETKDFGIDGGNKEQLVISFDFQRGGIASSQYAI